MDWTQTFVAGGGVGFVLTLFGKLVLRWLRGEQHDVSVIVAQKVEAEMEARLQDLMRHAQEREGQAVKAFQQTLRAELAEFETRLLDRIDEKYVSAEMARMQFQEFGRRATTLEDALRELHNYTHTRNHELANELMKLASRVMQP